MANMPTRILGKTDLEVSLVGYGASPLGNVFGETDVGEGRRAVSLAIDFGINFFDVSPAYGDTLAETRLGQALHGRRDEVVLATKFGSYGRSAPQRFDYSAKRLQSSVEES